MSLIIHFAFIREGTSDAPLIVPLIELCRLAGADDAKEVPLDWEQLGAEIGHSVSEKVKAALSQAPETELLFIHRDADGRDPTPRYEEIEEAIESLGVTIPYVAIVPVQETEAWILLDEQAIRDVSGNQTGRVKLNLPSPKQVEKIANPKERLKEILVKASGRKGRRLKKFRQSFPEHRRLLLETLDCSGGISKVPSWQRLANDVSEAIQKLKQKHGG